MTTALLLIDLQQAIDDPQWSRHGPRNNPDAPACQAALLRHWRARGSPVIHVRHDSTAFGSPYAPGTPGHAFLGHAVPLAGESVVAKSVNSAFIGTGLEALLRAAGIDTLVVAGVITNNSVEATVRMAGNLGFRVLLVEDACFTFALRDRAGTVHDAALVHALSLANLDPEYCRVIDTAAALRQV